MKTTNTLGLALGGGGVRGWAHVGVLSVLEGLGLRPDLVAGTSAGAITAAYLAAGFSVEEMTEVMRSQDTRALFSLRFDRYGLVDTADFAAYLRGHLGERRIEEMERPLFIVCTDLESGKEVVLERGPLVESVLASCAMPGVFAPVRLGGRFLIDGGVSNNVPVSALVNHGADFTIGIQLYKRIGALLGEAALEARSGAAGAEGAEAKVGLGLWAERLWHRFGREPEGSAPRPPNGLEVVGRALDIMMAQLEGFRLQAYRPDVLVTPRVESLGLLSFTQEKESIFQAGVEAAERRIEELEALARHLRGGARATEGGAQGKR